MGTIILIKEENLMTQKEFEIVKALAYEETPEQIAAAEGISMPDVEAIRTKFADEIIAAKADLKKAGYLK
jgi:FixJ family two-component response regulator